MSSISRLVLTDFRSYPALDLAFEPGLVALSGENGAGKTNLIEAISFLCPGRGLRRAELGECARFGSSGRWSIFAEVATAEGPRQLGVGAEAQLDSSYARRYRLDREPVASLKPFAEIVRIVWLTPSMDGLFAGPAGERRRFLDRLVLAVDAEHGTRVNALERALRNRNRLLEENAERRWLDAAESEVAELAIAVAAARVETVQHLVARIAAAREEASAFPHAELSLQGDVERLIGNRPAIEIEDAYRAMLRENRSRDAAAGRTLIGPQATDLLVRHGPKQADAARSSTGEQKALLVGLVLAHARLVAEVSGITPILLLDEIAAHLDAARREALFETLIALRAQVFMTGADAAVFAELKGRAQMLQVAAGRVSAAWPPGAEHRRGL
ncbi:MAG: DNA replication/repair protein RecF [Beijerinckiaceae bacterium]|nr:MAG: DNA replication/repair protein RecF [Beijerinckiaceae bacterium]